MNRCPVPSLTACREFEIKDVESSKVKLSKLHFTWNFNSGNKLEICKAENLTIKLIQHRCKDIKRNV